ncbi:MAG: hypothetical protein COT74_05450 [Bdellovibrionales bacterium CG10_big_fil_rev_8_21_14_0_10_45_34]|nr:MAG: hypothetical protein COT74_05450 [Bdellovibrionales bacterium CG10_big_fil_rev_8_21_14_0_10_45_34]
MTTELVILLSLFTFLMVGAFLGENSSLKATLRDASPRLGARLERHIEVGSGFAEKSRNGSIRDPITWQVPEGNPENQ